MKMLISLFLLISFCLPALADMLSASIEYKDL